MNFRPELAEAVMAGRKTATRRLVSDNPRSPWWREKCVYRVGQVVAVCPGRGRRQIGRARVSSVERMRIAHWRIKTKVGVPDAPAAGAAVVFALGGTRCSE